ncbi:MAG: UDP-3-O-acyl-N-acetylglucosamine deacetylase [Deltaproteobacteria bacterium]|nr:MAG: UDP-3-O-acyl-N-acetylglucosamine deacetylase [Deltaproteobacteria bacterium]
MNQRTIAERISCTGIGVHSGAPVRLTLHPARPDTGIVFVRTDGNHPVEIPARAEMVASTTYSTTLGRGSATVATVEHLLGALYGLGIDNVRVEIDGPEVPIMDGSAGSFVLLIRAARVYEQSVPRRVLRVRRAIDIRDGAKRIRIEPSRSFKVTYRIDYEHPAIGRQSLESLELYNGVFEREVARARTFGFVNEVEAFWEANLALGASFDNTVVLDERGVVNQEGLRWRDEFVRHKALDLLGDLALLGVPLRGHVKVERGGHTLHQQLVARLLASPEAARLRRPLPAAVSEAPVPALASA